MSRVALDSNILAYLAGVSRSAEDDAKIEAARAVVKALAPNASLIAPAQALGELFVALRRGKASAEEAREVLLEFAEAFGSSASDARTALAAADLVVDHKLQFWDALIVTAAAEAGCTLLLSEDLHHGFVARGLIIVNPFVAEIHPRLSALMGASSSG